jgi:OmcA/MtrC family decaheme c-type cytochrome
LGCTGPRGSTGQSGSGCTVTSSDGGVKVISCADGTSVTVSNGQPGSSCTVSEADGGGAKTITCADGTTVTVTDGQPGTSCTIATGDAGVKVITCADGTSVTVPGQGAAPPIATALGEGDDLPGVVLQILSVAGGSGPNGNFEIGDTVSVTYTVRTKAGTSIPLAQLNGSGIWISGPTSNYQHILPASRTQLTFSDLLTASALNADGSYTYTFSVPLPATYGPPLWDTTKFTDGELTGQPLQHGTYTLGMRVYKNYTVGTSTATVRDAGNASKDFLLGSVTTLEPREVVTLANCNSCHVTLQAHGGTTRDTKLCVTCHTAGAEDKNSTDTNDPTPVTVDFKSMIHKLHNGAHLPSVIGVAVNADGTRNFAATPAPFVVNTNDFSGVQFPVWPNLSIPMPRPRGYSALTTAQQGLSDQIGMGVTACDKCHGDPDGSGPLPAPAQGDFAYSHESRVACGSCHDDIDWTKPYKKNTDSGMPAQPDDSNCALCHPATGTAVGGSPIAAHLHPLYDPTVNPGFNVAVSRVAEAGSTNGNGKLDPGEKVAVTFTMTDDSGNALAASVVASLSVVVTGPSFNRNLLLSGSIPSGALTGSQPWTVNLPDVVLLEQVGTSTATTGDVFTTARTPHLNITGAATTVFVRTATGGGSTLAAAAGALQNFVDVQSASPFLRNDYIVVEDGVAGRQEYLRVQFVDRNRLWFGAGGAATYQPGLRLAHSVGATVTKVTLATKALGTDYTLAAATGTITEVTEFGAGAAVLASYTTDFIMPSVYGPPLNDSPDLGQAAGKWKGLPLVDGTYTVGIWGSRTLTLSLNGESNSYRGTSRAGTADFLVGAATTITPTAIISSAQNCETCHNDVYGHGGGRRGADACLLCHGSAGSEDRPRYVAAAAPATPGLSIEFRSMLHKIHMGSSLTNAATFNVVGFGAGAYPNNFGILNFGEVEFPAMPDGVKDCKTCHGTSTAWQSPADRSHPTAATAEAQVWRVSCGSCHDSDAAGAHFDAMTSSIGNESCSVCHDSGRDLPVTVAHKIR